MGYSDYKCFRFGFDSGVVFVSINHPPINLLDDVLSAEFERLGRELEADDSVRVVVLQSALPDFFIAHSGLGRVGAAPKRASHTRNFRLTQMIGERFRNMPKVTIAKIEGRARGGGNEIALAMDMCFAAVGKAIFGQPEVAVGLVPGGGSTQRLPRLIGRGRALEVLLGCDDFSAELAERYGYINRALPADELTPFVERLAHRIASFPAHTVAHVKAAVDLGTFGSLAEGLLVEARESDLSVASEVTQARVAEALKALQGSRCPRLQPGRQSACHGRQLWPRHRRQSATAAFRANPLSTPRRLHARPGQRAPELRSSLAEQFRNRFSDPAGRSSYEDDPAREVEDARKFKRALVC